MKHSVILLFFCLLNSSLFAQKKHSIAIGVDYVENIFPKEWNNSHIKKRNYYYNSDPILPHTGLWVGYYYKNRYSLKLNGSWLDQSANYTPADEMPANFLEYRATAFCDLSFGWNFLQSLQPQISGWIYAGIGYCGGTLQRSTLISYSQGHTIPSGHGDFAKFYPTIQAMIKYHPLKKAFVGIGGTYRYLFNDFQPLSLNVSLGVQL